MFCGKCGTEVENSAKFCPKCGELVNTAVGHAGVQPQKVVTGAAGYTYQMPTDYLFFTDLNNRENIGKYAGVATKVIAAIAALRVLIYLLFERAELLDYAESFSIELVFLLAGVSGSLALCIFADGVAKILKYKSCQLKAGQKKEVLLGVQAAATISEILMLSPFIGADEYDIARWGLSYGLGGASVFELFPATFIFLIVACGLEIFKHATLLSKADKAESR